MKVEVNQKVDGVGSELYLITTNDVGEVNTELYLGNGHKDVLLQFFKRNNWDEEFVMETYNNVGWVFNEDWDEDEYDGEGIERIEVDEIGEVFE